MEDGNDDDDEVEDLDKVWDVQGVQMDVVGYGLVHHVLVHHDLVHHDLARRLFVLDHVAVVVEEAYGDEDDVGEVSRVDVELVVHVDILEEADNRNILEEVEDRAGKVHEVQAEVGKPYVDRDE